MCASVCIICHTDGLVISHTGEFVISHTDELVMSHTDTDKLVLSHTDGLVLSHTDGFVISHTDELVMSHTDKLVMSHTDVCCSVCYMSHRWIMGWLRLVGSLKLYASFAEYRLLYRALLQKRPIILRSLLIVATP